MNRKKMNLQERIQNIFRLQDERQNIFDGLSRQRDNIRRRLNDIRDGESEEGKKVNKYYDLLYLVFESYELLTRLRLHRAPVNLPFPPPPISVETMGRMFNRGEVAQLLQRGISADASLRSLQDNFLVTMSLRTYIDRLKERELMHGFDNINDIFGNYMTIHLTHDHRWGRNMTWTEHMIELEEESLNEGNHIPSRIQSVIDGANRAIDERYANIDAKIDDARDAVNRLDAMIDAERHVQTVSMTGRLIEMGSSSSGPRREPTMSLEQFKEYARRLPVDKFIIPSSPQEGPQTSRSPRYEEEERRRGGGGGRFHPYNSNIR
jgi:hypothetical protein